MNATVLRYHRFHSSYLLGVFGAGLLAGLVFGRLDTATPSTFLLFISLILLLGGFRSQRWWALVAVLLAGLCLGSVRAATVQQEYERYQDLIGSSVQVVGMISSDPQLDRRDQQRVTLRTVSVDSEAYPGEMYVTIFSNEILKRGDEVVIKGKVKEGFASYGAVLSSGKLTKVVRGGDIIRDIRERFSSVIRTLITDPMASLGLGFVVGQRSTLPESLDEQLKIVGLTHIVVASGYNLTILVRFVMRLFARYSRYLAFMVSLITIVCFVLFSGMSPSMNRAVIVTVLGLLAWYVGRRFHPVLLILYVASVTAFFNPMYVWSDLGWYLSFFAFAGILVLAPLVISLLYRRRDASPFEQLVIETLSAEVMALPIIAFAFGTIPVFGLVANVLVAPLIPAAMALTALTGIAGMLSLSIGSIIALPTEIIIAYAIAVVEWLAEIPGAQVTFNLGIGPIFAWYSVTIIAVLYVRRKFGYDFRQPDNRLMV